MKKEIFSLMLLVFLLLAIPLNAQDKTYPTKKVNGIEYYIYTVQASEGLYAISRRFNVSQGDINNVNPEIHSGLKVGQQILIPIVQKTTENIKAEPEIIQKQQFIQHKVEKRQTLFAISRIYNISQDDIKKHNPQIEKRLREGDILLIPNLDNKKNEVAKVESKQQTTNFRTHEVQPKETLYSISKLYAVEIDEIIRLNPGSDNKLSIGTTLKIPSQQTTKSVEQKKENGVSPSSRPIVDLNKIFGKQDTIKLNDKKPFRIAFLLPFMVEHGKKDASVDRFLDFYSGALLAIYEARQKGFSFEIFTFDTEKSEQKVSEVLTNDDLKTVDLIIGPAFSNQVQFVTDFAKKHKVKTLIPFTSKVPDIETNPYLFQFNPGSDSEMKYSYELLTTKYNNAHLIFAELPDISLFDEGKIAAENLQNELKTGRKTYSTFRLTNPEYTDFGTILKKGIKNIIIFNSDKYAFVSPYLSSLRSRTKEYDIVLFEQYSWRNQTDKMPSAIFTTPFMSNINPLKLESFDKKIIQHFKRDAITESPRFDLLGYDLTTYFVSLMSKYGENFIEKMDVNPSINGGIQSQPLFQRTFPGGGFINHRLYFGTRE